MNLYSNGKRCGFTILLIKIDFNIAKNASIKFVTCVVQNFLKIFIEHIIR